MNIMNVSGASGCTTANLQRYRALSRHSAVIGAVNQVRLSQLTVGIVGAGGIGSELIDKLMRLAPKRLLIIDDDSIEYSNLNRVVGSTYKDASEKTHKTALASRQISGFNPEQEFTVLSGDFLEPEYQAEFKACDVIFSATDNVASRFAACALGLANGSLVIDVATGIIMDNNNIESAGGQVYFLTPDSGWCPLCAGFYDQRDISLGLLDEEEYARQRKQGYVRGGSVVAPQVGALNAILAGYAVWLFMRLVSGEEPEFDGIAVDALTFSAYTWREERPASNHCHYCSENGNLMLGDDAELVVRSKPISITAYQLPSPECTQDDDVETADESANPKKRWHHSLAAGIAKVLKIHRWNRSGR